MNRPYAWVIDDSTTYGPWLCFCEETANAKRGAGKKVVEMFADPEQIAAPGPAEREASQRARTIMADAEAMKAIRRLRSMAGVGDGINLAGAVDAIAYMLNDKGVIPAARVKAGFGLEWVPPHFGLGLAVGSTLYARAADVA